MLYVHKVDAVENTPCGDRIRRRQSKNCVCLTAFFFVWGGHTKRTFELLQKKTTVLIVPSILGPGPPLLRRSLINPLAVGWCTPLYIYLDK